MNNILSIRLEAHNDAANRHRVYAVMVGRDLFSHWSLRICYGRAGSRLREITMSGERTEIRRLLREHLRRRLSAPRRIGCAYRLCALDVPPGEAERDWIPAELIQAFLGATNLPARIAA